LDTVYERSKYCKVDAKFGDDEVKSGMVLEKALAFNTNFFKVLIFPSHDGMPPTS